MSQSLPTTAAEYVGKFIALRKHMMPRNLLHIQPVIYRVAGVQGSKRLRLELAHGQAQEPLTFTVMGDNIAGCFDTLDLAKFYLLLVERVKTQFDVLEAEAMADLERKQGAPPAQSTVTARTRSRPVPVAS